ncbi:MAG: hypothetical protein V7785_14555 [Bermanella sp.]
MPKHFLTDTAIKLVFITVFLCGCSTTPVFWYKDTDQLIQEHNYKKALQQAKTVPNYNQAYVKEIKGKAVKHLRTQLAAANRLIKQKEWGQIGHIINQLKNTQPPSPQISKLEDKLKQARSEEQRLLDTAQALAQANLLQIAFKQQNLSNRIHNNSFDWFDKDSQLQDHKQQLAQNLLQLSIQALSIKDYKNAQRTFQAAITFNEMLGHGKMQQDINDGLSQQNKSILSNRQHSLLNQLNAAINEQDFPLLIRLQNILSNEPFHGHSVQTALLLAKDLRLAQAKELDQKASHHYRQGKIIKALEQWQLALTLTPEDLHIHSKFLRAQKVQTKLKKLQPIAN